MLPGVARARLPSRDAICRTGPTGRLRPPRGQKIIFSFAGLDLFPREIAARLHLRKQIGARDGELSARRVDALGRNLQVVVLLQGCADKFLQLRILEDLPPGKIRVGRCLRLDLRVFAQIAVGGRSLNVGPMVVRADGAPGRLRSRPRTRQQYNGANLFMIAPLFCPSCPCDSAHFSHPAPERALPATPRERAPCPRRTISPPGRKSQARRKFRSRWRPSSRRSPLCP